MTNLKRSMSATAILAKIVAAIVALWASLSDKQKSRIIDAILDTLEPIIRKFYRRKPPEES
jgi:hypothetical protein